MTRELSYLANNGQPLRTQGEKGIGRRWKGKPKISKIHPIIAFI
jgi:hypothetical protein